MAAVSGHTRFPSGTPSSSPFIEAQSMHDKLPGVPRGRASLGSLLRRSKSKDQGLRSNKKEHLAERQRELLLLQQNAIAQEPLPSLPVLYNGGAAPQLSTFDNDTDDAAEAHKDRPDSIAIATRRATHVPNKLKESALPRSISRSSQMASITEQGDPYARTESMTHRGRHSYATSIAGSATGSINGPRRVRRRKDPVTFNILILGTQNAGKTSFINFLKTSLEVTTKKRTEKRTTSQPRTDFFPEKTPSAGNFVPHYVEAEIDGERLGITLWDSEGLERSLVDLQLRDMTVFLESKFEETFNEEMKVVRAAGAQDTHIHCAFLLLDPARLDKNIATVKARLASVLTNGRHTLPNVSDKIFGGLDEDVDLNVIRAISKKTTLIPVISKADSITTAHMSYLKRTVWDSLRKSDLDPLAALDLDDEIEVSNNRDSHISEEDEESDEESAGSDTDIKKPSTPVEPRQSHNRQSTVMESPLTISLNQDLPFLPFSTISPDLYEPDVAGRRFPWGFADPFDPEHCDFLRLKESVFTDWRNELRDVCRETWYEQWRTSRLDSTTSKSIKR